ncbi:MAG: chemotaxis protein CheX [Terracidiphilus sp.]
MSMEITPDVVTHIVQSIFTTMLDIEVSTVAAPSLPTGDRLTSSVYLEGEWNGAVSLECNHRQACQFAGKLLAMDPPEEVDDDVRDVLGELANMIGGNIKSLMSTDVRLSLPSVIGGSHYEVRICGSKVRDKVGFSFHGGNFWVTILAKDRPAPRKSRISDSLQATM